MMALGKHVGACCILATVMLTGISFSTAKTYTQQTGIKMCKQGDLEYQCGFYTTNVTIPYGVCYAQQSQSSSRRQTNWRYRQSGYWSYGSSSYGCGSWWRRRTCYRRTSRWVYYRNSEAWYSTGYYMTYYSKQICCSNYVKQSNGSCLPTCPSTTCSENGFCYKPGECRCYKTYQWKGDRCRDDVALGKWCASVETELEIKTSHLDSAVLERLYCTNSDEVGIEYNSTDAKSASEQITADSKRAVSQMTKHWLYEFWRHHPTIRRYCCISGDSEDYTKYLNTLLKFNSSIFIEYANALSSEVAIELRKELNSVCSSSLSGTFCPLKAILELVDKAPNASSFSSWTTQDKNAYKVNFILLKKKHPLLFAGLNVTLIQEQTIMMDTTDYILRAYERNEITELETISNYLPSDGQYKKGKPCNNDNFCIFLRIIEAIRKFIREISLYESPPKIGGRVRRVVPTGVDFKAFFKEIELDGITKLSSNKQQLSRKIGNKLKKGLSNGFEDLFTYFEDVKHFNNKIISVDISDDQIQNFANDIEVLLPKIKSAIEDLINETLIMVGDDVADAAITLLCDIIEAVNPIKWLTSGESSSSKDILESAAELTSTTAGLDNEYTTIKAIKGLQKKAIVVAKVFDGNQTFLSDVKKLLTKDSGMDFEQANNNFLNSYEKYNPNVTRSQITELASYWKSVIESACAMDKGSDLKDCMKVNTDIAKMIELHSQAFDFQFNVMNSLAAKMRAQNAIKATNELKQEFKSASKLRTGSATTTPTLVMIGSLNYVAYRANLLQAVILYCNVLEYKDNFVVNEKICKGPSTSIDPLVSFVPRLCTVEVQKFFHGIPTKPSGSGDEAYMDIDKLYSGSPMYFKIPNSQWLVDRNWIFTSQKSYAIYIKQFEVFLPTASDTDRNILVRAMPLMNEKLPGGTVYDIEPQRSLLQFGYTEGPTAGDYCRGSKSNLNPYTTCLGSSSNTICHNTGEVIREVYPSIYARWNISMEGYKNTGSTTKAC